ncbi:MAG TPA: TonB-dependent receptor [Chitinophaga sp.]|uniref:TonB-dependent receptor n=1 Tax=Chitinophaga sp. TaxID=1869181 RepID=UPI002DBF9DEA|nr:TonB-dependent receptor [Chitinophaga sp.]HEU4552672.1 TonB-dependent receptor [Chitinophaga sp.]
MPSFTNRQLLTAVFTFLSINAFAQTAIKGTVRDINNIPVQKVSVTLLNKQHSTVTDTAGAFSFIGLPAGKYTIRFSHTGLTPDQKSISLGNGETRVVDMVLVPSTEQLQTVEITGRKESGYKNTNSFIGSKTATPLREVPQSISYVTKELMQDQSAVRVGDVVKNFSGVNQFTFYDDLTIRGFRINGGSTTQLLNGMRTFTGFWKQPMVNYLERVEVIKGPASALFGNASPGGTVNRVTKKPLEEARKSLSFTTGSFNTTRALADFTGPLNDEKTILYRLNLGYENAQSFRDLQFDKNIVIAPSISFLPTPKTRLNFDAVYNKSNSRLDRGQSVFNGTDQQALYTTPISLSLAAVNDHLDEETFTVMTSLTHQFSSRLAFNLSYLRTGYIQDLVENRSANAYAVDSSGAPISNLVARQAFIRQSKQFSDNISAYLTYDANTGKLAHKLLLGYDYAQNTLPPGSSQQTASGYLKKDGTAGAYNPRKKDDYVFYNYKVTDTHGRPIRNSAGTGDSVMYIPRPNTPSYDLIRRNNQLEDMTKYVFSTASNSATIPVFGSLSGIYAQDQVKLGPVQVLVGVRYEQYTDKANYKTDSVKNVRQHAFLPRIGAVYTLNHNINIYGIYTKGYNPQDPAVQANRLTGGPFDPIESNLVEGGLKTEWLGGRLTANLAVYRIRQKGTLYNASDPNNPDLMVQIGEEEAKGVELDVAGKLAPNWDIVASYAYNNAEITASGKSDADLVGVQKPNAPRQQGNLWTKYTISAGPIKGFGIGAGANFVTERNLSLNKVQNIPGFALLNAALYYKVNKVQVQFNLNNITNKVYWVGGYDYLRLFPGTPRNWQATVSYTF